MSKKIKSTWIYDDVKVEFSEPSIQAWESVVHAKEMIKRNGKENLFHTPGTSRRCYVLMVWQKSC